MLKMKAARLLSVAILGLVISASTSSANDELPGDGGGPPSCLAGGVGATYCKFEAVGGWLGCDVTCTPPFYACCTLGGNCNCFYSP